MQLINKAKNDINPKKHLERHYCVPCKFRLEIIIIIIIIITIRKLSNLIGYQLPWFQP